MTLTRTSIERTECDSCSRTWPFEVTSDAPHFYAGRRCLGKRTLRRYVAVDALLSDEAIAAACRVSGEPTPANIRVMRHIIQTAVSSTGTGGAT